VPIANVLIASHTIPPPPGDQDPATWVQSQLAQSVMTTDNAEVAKLQAQLSTTSNPQQQATLKDQIAELNTQIGQAQNLFDNLVQAARGHIGDQQ
jgi:spore coat protein CotF